MTPKPHERLTAAIDDRRADLGLSLRKVADIAGITEETLRAIRRGANRPSSLTKRGIEKALHWAPGSIDAILAGGGASPGVEDPRIAEIERSTVFTDEEKVMLIQRIRELPPFAEQGRSREAG